VRSEQPDSLAGRRACRAAVAGQRLRAQVLDEGGDPGVRQSVDEACRGGDASAVVDGAEPEHARQQGAGHAADAVDAEHVQ